MRNQIVSLTANIQFRELETETEYGKIIVWDQWIKDLISWRGDKYAREMPTMRHVDPNYSGKGLHSHFYKHFIAPEIERLRATH